MQDANINVAIYQSLQRDLPTDIVLRIIDIVNKRRALAAEGRRKFMRFITELFTRWPRLRGSGIAALIRSRLRKSARMQFPPGGLPFASALYR